MDENGFSKWFDSVFSKAMEPDPPRFVSSSPIFDSHPLDDFVPATVEESEWFLILRESLKEQNDFLEKQLRAFEEYSKQARESSRMAWRWSLASIIVAALSLFVAGLSLLGQFGVIG